MKRRKIILVSWFKLKLPSLAQTNIPHHIFSVNPSICELQGFSHASENGYTAAVYIRSVAQGNNHSDLICGKSKVVPLKPVSILCLELCAGVILPVFFRKAYEPPIVFDNIFAWTDSIVTLAQIRSSLHKWKNFETDHIS